jgi:Na+/proline symporter/signal transduction histidine kinase
MIESWGIILISFAYLAVLFFIAFVAEKQAKRGKSWLSSPYIYALSLAVYCTAWTYYGSIGRATQNGFDFLTIYLGPTLSMPLWWLLMRKVIRISKTQNISSLADFLSSRYGKSFSLGAIVAIFSFLGIVPYIALQIKAISESYLILSGTRSISENVESGPILYDPSFYITLVLGIFTIFYGIKTVESTERRDGLITSIAFESVIKLLAFLSVGSFITFYVFDGFGDIFNSISLGSEGSEHMITLPGENSSWFTMLVLSFFAIFFLPRQFQVSVIENTSESHLKKAIWLFPAYLLVINIFVLPVAAGGELLLKNEGFDADYYLLAFPVFYQRPDLSILTYIGGLSAATSMIIVSSIALSIMLSNHVISPFFVRFQKENTQINLNRVIVFLRRFTILIILFAAYAYFKFVAQRLSLVSIGLISFCAVAQFAPAFFAGLFWKEASRRGAIAGIVSGGILWIYTMIIPTLIEVGFMPATVATDGLFSISFLKPQQLFGMENLSFISHGFFWSILINIFVFCIVSLAFGTVKKEETQGELFVNIFKYSPDSRSPYFWKGQFVKKDLINLLKRILGPVRAEEIIKEYQKTYGRSSGKSVDGNLISYVEGKLASAVGASSARVMIASVVKNGEVNFREIISIVKESKEILELNKVLKERTDALKKVTFKLSEANERLQKIDEEKDEFISTVTHELRTPITTIRALTEIIHDNPDMEEEEKANFLDTILSETERISRLVSVVLDLEKLERGQQILNRQYIPVEALVKQCMDSVQEISGSRKVVTEINLTEDIYVDKDRIIQVLINLLSNAIKYTDSMHGVIKISVSEQESNFIFDVHDNGKGISPEDQLRLFEKFFQARDQTRKKPKGTGLGLSITKKIIELHGGRIWIESSPGEGSSFKFTIPRIEENGENQESTGTNEAYESINSRR